MTNLWHCCNSILVLYIYTDTSTDSDHQLNVNVNGKPACPGEEVIFTCTVPGVVLFWDSDAFTRITMSTASAPTKHGDFAARIVNVVSCDRHRSLTSSLTVTARPELNGTEVTCTDVDYMPQLHTSLLVAGKFNIQYNHDCWLISYILKSQYISLLDFCMIMPMISSYKPWNYSRSHSLYADLLFHNIFTCIS